MAQSLTGDSCGIRIQESRGNGGENGDRNPELYSYWAGKRAIASDMETAVLFVLGSLRGVRTASILNVVAASQSSVAEDIGKYAAKEAISMSGEEREILTALEAFTRIQK